MGRGLRVPPPVGSRGAAISLTGLARAQIGAETVPVIPRTRCARTIDDAYIAYQDFGEAEEAVAETYPLIAERC